MENEPKWDLSKLSFGSISAEAITVFCHKCMKYVPCDCDKPARLNNGTAADMTAGCVICGAGDCEHLRKAKEAR